MRFTFTHGHTTTQRSESGNSSIKARGELEDLLASATLVGMHEIVDIAIRRNHRRALEELISLRKDNKHVGTFFTASVDMSMRLCATKVISCELTHCMVFTRFVTTTALLHFRIFRVIFSCTCSCWMSTKKHCKCIIRACNEARMNPCSVQNIRPIFHVQRHPLWTLTPESLNMEDYSDFDFDNTPSSKKRRKRTYKETNPIY